MGTMTRADRLAINRASLAATLAARPIRVRGVYRPASGPARIANRLEYVEVGKCSVCKYTWRTNMTGGEIKQHGPRNKPCRGSHKAPLKHTVVLKDLYVPGEPWPKSWS